MRSTFLFLLILALVPICAANPFVGLLVWFWLSYMAPHRLTWGAAYAFPFAQVVAAATLIGILVRVGRGGLPRMPWTRELSLLCVLWFMFLVTTVFAIRPDLAWTELGDVSKVLLMTLPIPLLVHKEMQLRLLLLVTALSIGFYGLKGGIWGLLRGEQGMVWGPPNSSIADNTALGLALNMILPLLFLLALDEPRRWLKRLLQLTFVLSVVAILFTYSRGAFLGLVVVLSLIFVGLRLKTKLVVATLLLVTLPVVVSQLPDRWFERMETIETYENDTSAMRRIHAWTAAWRLAIDRPLVGGGFEIVNDPTTHRKYNPGTLKIAGVHSVYFEILAENGFITLGVFVLLMLSTVASAVGVRRVARENNLTRHAHYAQMLMISICGYAVSGAFLEMASFDLYYQMLAMVVALKAIVTRELEARQNSGPAEQPLLPRPVAVRAN